MSKINKYANLYDKDGNLIRKVDENTGKLENYTLEELEELVDKLANDKDENGRVKNPVALNNANIILMQYYMKYGNPHIDEWLKKLHESKSVNEQFAEKIKEVAEDLKNQEEQEQTSTNLDEEYVDFEEINDQAA